MGRCESRPRIDGRRWFEPKRFGKFRAAGSGPLNATRGAPRVSHEVWASCLAKRTHTVAPLGTMVSSRFGRPRDLVRTSADWLGSAMRPRRNLEKRAELGFRKRLVAETKNPLPGGSGGGDTRIRSISLNHFLIGARDRANNCPVQSSRRSGRHPSPGTARSFGSPWRGLRRSIDAVNGESWGKRTKARVTRLQRPVVERNQGAEFIFLKIARGRSRSAAPVVAALEGFLPPQRAGVSLRRGGGSLRGWGARSRGIFQRGALRG